MESCRYVGEILAHYGPYQTRLAKYLTYVRKFGAVYFPILISATSVRISCTLTSSKEYDTLRTLDAGVVQLHPSLVDGGDEPSSSSFGSQKSCRRNQQATACSKRRSSCLSDPRHVAEDALFSAPLGSFTGCKGVGSKINF